MLRVPTGTAFGSRYKTHHHKIIMLPLAQTRVRFSQLGILNQLIPCTCNIAHSVLSYCVSLLSFQEVITYKTYLDFSHIIVSSGFLQQELKFFLHTKVHRQRVYSYSDPWYN